MDNDSTSTAGASIGRYAAGAFSPVFGTKQATGTVHVAGSSLRFESPAGTVELPLDGLKARPGGANESLLFFEHPSHPGVVIHTADHSILNERSLSGQRELRQQGERIHSRRRFYTMLWLSIAGILIATIAGLWMARGWLAERLADRVPPDWEVKLGDATFLQVKATAKFIDNPIVQREVEQLVAPLVKAVGPTPYPFQFHVIDDATINAFALPGGHVVIHSGLLLKAETPEEVAGVLAHELAHITRRHSLRNLIRAAGLSAVLQATIGDSSGLIAFAGDQANFLLQQKFSRDFEREADDQGWDYLVKAGIDPDGMIRFFSKLKEEEKKTGAMPEGAEKVASLFGTHPATTERIEHLTARRATLGAMEKKSISGDFKALQEALRPLVKKQP
ncbi:MAG TPA: M48 family metallopeptidase [Roseimicrobium sp.]|nr:M48 family metallopeptidase [Roseimicrobium sp.]